MMCPIDYYNGQSTPVIYTGTAQQKIWFMGRDHECEMVE